MSDMPAVVKVLTPRVMVLVEGADTQCPVDVDAGLTLAVNDRVTVRTRDPQRPLVTSKPSSS